MPVIRIKLLHVEDARANPKALFLFGDNEQREGLGGLAKVLRKEPNAVGIRTKRAPGRNPGDYWSDERYDRNTEMIRADFDAVIQHVGAGGLVIIPLAGLGTGLSELPKRAPRTFGFLEFMVETITNAPVGRRIA